MIANVRLEQPSLVIILLLVTSVGAGAPLQSQTNGLKTDDEEAAVKSVSLRFLDACIKDDRATMNALWHLGARRPVQINRELLDRGDQGTLSLEAPKFSHLNIRQRETSLRMVVGYVYKDWETGARIDEPFSYNVTLVKINGEWKVSGLSYAFLDLISAFLTAKSFDAESRLLGQEQELLNSTETINIVSWISYHREDENSEKLDRLLMFIAERSEYELGRSHALWQLGDSLIEEERYKDALAKFRESRDTSEKLGKRLMVAAAEAGMGRTYIHLKDDQQGQTHQALALSLYLKEPQDMFAAINAERRFAYAYYNTKQYGKAADRYLKALKLSQDSNEREWQATLLKDAGDCYLQQQKYTEAEEAYRKSLSEFNTLPNKPATVLGLLSVWDIYNSLAELSAKRKDFNGAVNFYDLARSSAVQSKSPEGIIASHKGLAEFYLESGDKVRAVKTYNVILERLSEIGSRHRIAEQLRLLTSDMAFEAGEVKLGEEFLKQGTQKYGRWFSQRENAWLLMTQVMLDFIKGDWSRIDELCQKVLDIEEAQDEVKIMASVMTSMILVFKNQLDVAFKALGRAEAVARNGTSRELLDIVIHFKLVMMLAAEAGKEGGKLRKPTADMEKLITEISDPNIKRMTYIYLAGVYLSNSENDKSSKETGLNYLKEIIRTADPDDPLQSVTTMMAWLFLAAVSKEEGQYQEALNALREVKRQAEESGLFSNLMWGLKGFEAEIHVTKGDKEQAKILYAQAIDALELQRDNITGGAIGRIQFFNNVNELYKQFITLLVEQGDVDRALLYAERAKARTLLDLDPQASQPKWNKFKEWLPGAIIMLTGVDTDGVPPAAPLSPESPVNLPFHSPDETKTLLPDKQTAILEYVVTDDKTYLFVLTADDMGKNVKAGDSYAEAPAAVSWHLYPVEINKHSLTYYISKFKDLIINNRSGYTAYSQFLYGLLIPQQARDLLAGKSSLIIIPDSVLWSLPFQALQSEPDHFLLETYNISYAPSLSIFRQAHKLRGTHEAQPLPPAQKDVLVIGNPNKITQVVESGLLGKPLFPFITSGQGTDGNTNEDEGRLLLKPLPGVAAEISMMPNVYGNRVEILIGPAGTKSNFQRVAGRFRIIHLATHGILSSTTPMESSIVLGPESPKNSTRANGRPDKLLKVSSDQLLSAREVMEMRLRADLVVLSACDTAGGSLSEGEGVIGLTWAFAAAGVPTVVASQWAIHDRTTADLMEVFHRRLQSYRQKDGTVRQTAAALTEAARVIARKREYRHPYYWAAFIVVGNGQ